MSGTSERGVTEQGACDICVASACADACTNDTHTHTHTHTHAFPQTTLFVVSKSRLIASSARLVAI